MVDSILDEEMLIYRAKLPLIHNNPYLYYRIDSWPLPFNTSGYSVQIKTVQDIGLDAKNGLVVQTHKCAGNNPIVCNIGILYKDNQYKCERGILNGNHMERQHCDVSIRKSTEQSQIV